MKNFNFPMNVRSRWGSLSLLSAFVLWCIPLEELAEADTFLVPYATEALTIAEGEPVALIEHLRQETDAEVIAVLADHIVATETFDWPKGYRGAFLQDIAVAALISAKTNQIPPSIIIGQAIFESGWGRSRLAREYNNLFGIKGYGKGSVLVNTFERTSKDRRYRKRATFKTFSNRQEAIVYHGELLAEDRRYASARRYRHDWRKFIELASPYYASSPKYAQRVVAIVEYYNLDRWDSLVQGTIDGEEPETAVSRNVR